MEKLSMKKRMLEMLDQLSNDSYTELKLEILFEAKDVIRGFNKTKSLKAIKAVREFTGVFLFDRLMTEINPIEVRKNVYYYPLTSVSVQFHYLGLLDDFKTKVEQFMAWNWNKIVGIKDIAPDVRVILHTVCD